MPAPKNHLLTFSGDRRAGLSDQFVGQISTQSQRPMEENPVARNNGEANLFVSAGLLVFVLLLFLFKYLKGRQKPSSLAQHPELKQQHPCSKCRFYNQNPYLQCAVHPENFDQIAPEDCPDFWAVDQDEFLTK
jgi:hypothetical protein